MKDKTIKTVSFILVICISVVLGIAINEVWSYAERKTHPLEYSEIVSKYSLEYGVPESVIYATIKTESGFDNEAVSSAGAIGLMQMMPSTFEWLASEEHLDEPLTIDDLKDPEISIKYGTYYLAYLGRKFDHNPRTVAAAYNAGEGRVATWLSSHEYSDMKGNLTDIPYKETRSYVKKINDAIDMYKKLYPDLT